jgi:hypothetical protein
VSTWLLVPDRRVEVLAGVEIAADPVEHIAFARELIECGLILCGIQPMAGGPGVGGTSLETAGKASPGAGSVTVDENWI